ncbi:MAG: hypothetical protein JW729_04390 [Bacteroidales bacterium]|nr:hypothetical protein [Bacteroidales bacterium]
MSASKSKTQVQILENYRLALVNVEDQPELAQAMSEYGYDSTRIAEGKALWDAARASFDEYHQIKQLSLLSKNEFHSKLQRLDLSYGLHRKKARIVFRKDATMLKNLQLNGRLAKGYIPRIETIKTFYHSVQADPAIQLKLTRLKIENIDIATGLLLLKTLEQLRASYLIKLSERQEATKAKDKAFRLLKDWMIEFFMVAKIAMQDRPQLLEALGLTVKS